MLRGGYNDIIREQQEPDPWPFPLNVATLLRQRCLQVNQDPSNQEPDGDGLQVALLVSVSLMGFIVLIWCVDCCRHCCFDEDPGEPDGPARLGQVTPTVVVVPRDEKEKNHQHHHHNSNKTTSKKATNIHGQSVPSSKLRLEDKSSSTSNTQTEHTYR